jgi:hypothetical protein
MLLSNGYYDIKGSVQFPGLFGFHNEHMLNSVLGDYLNPYLFNPYRFRSYGVFSCPTSEVVFI